MKFKVHVSYWSGLTDEMVIEASDFAFAVSAAMNRIAAWAGKREIKEMIIKPTFSEAIRN